MNPIEHLCDALKLAVRRHKPSPTNFRELEVVLQWENIPQSIIQNLIRSICPEDCDFFISLFYYAPQTVINRPTNELTQLSKFDTLITF